MPQAFPLRFSADPGQRQERLGCHRPRRGSSSTRRWRPRLPIKRALSAKLSSWRNESANHTQPGISVTMQRGAALAGILFFTHLISSMVVAADLRPSYPQGVEGGGG